MAYTNTRELLGDQATLDGLVAHTLTEFVEDGVTSVATGALMSNTGLVSVTMPNLKSFAQSAFAMCTNLETMIAPSATAGGATAFQGCTKLASVDFPMMTTLGTSMFAGCTALSTASFSSATTVASSAFMSCIALNDVSFPKAASVYRSAFIDAPIHNLVLPMATTIQSYICSGFGACAIDLAKKVTFSANALANDRNLFGLILRSTSMTTIPNVNVLAGTPIASGYGKVYVPDDMVDSYKSASNWATYAAQIDSLDNLSSVVPIGLETITDSWADIFAAEANDTYKTKYSVGDTKWLLAGNGWVLMQIVAFDTDELSDDTGTAKITWLCKGYQGLHVMNQTSTTAGGWPESDMYAYLNTAIYGGMDATVKANIKTVKKTYKQTTPSSAILVSNDLIWIPSYREMFGGTSYENSGCTYTAFFTSDSLRVKYIAWTTGSAYNWWLRSASSGTNFAYVNYNGGGNYNTAYTAIGVVFGFCT